MNNIGIEQFNLAVALSLKAMQSTYGKLIPVEVITKIRINRFSLFFDCESMDKPWQLHKNIMVDGEITNVEQDFFSFAEVLELFSDSCFPTGTYEFGPFLEVSISMKGGKRLCKVSFCRMLMGDLPRIEVSGSFNIPLKTEETEEG